jgi:hypothetical protein
MKGRASLRAASVAVVLAMTALAPRASAQTNEELKAARELFQEAYKAEQEKRYPEALEKFQRVAKVKESASVRYRIATVLAAMGRLREARDKYRALANDKPSLPASDHETADSAAEKANDLDKRIPKLVVSVPENAPPDTKVTVDGEPVAVTSTTPKTVEVEPGEHVVAASAPGAAPYDRKVTVAEGAGEVPHVVALEPEKKATPVQTVERRDNTLAWVALGGGGALLLVGGGLLLAREGAIDEIKTACPGNVCPTSVRTQVEDDRDRAELFGPLGGTLAVVGLVAVGVGVYMLVRPSEGGQRASSALSRPIFGPTPRGTTGMRLGFAF